MALLSNEKTLFKELNLEIPGIKDKDSVPNDFYSFLLHKVLQLWSDKIQNNEALDPKGGSYERLQTFSWNRSNFKKAIMTMPYNSSAASQKNYLTEDLYSFGYEKENKIMWYSYDENNREPRINSKDASLVVANVKYIIYRDFEKIKKLSKYLINIAKLFNALELPITWRLPTGLTVIQSYLQTVSTSITPFTYSKTRLNLSTRTSNYDHKKQVVSLMPNLIHSLDATSMYLLYKSFTKTYPEAQFFSVHDCFGTTTDKVATLKVILASVYTDLYSQNHYLSSFDEDMLRSIETNTDIELDKSNRTVNLANGSVYTIHDINWVVGDLSLDKKMVKKIDSQHLII